MIHRLTILGVGLLGGSAGMAARERIKDCRVVGYGRSAESIDVAVRAGALDEGTTELKTAVAGAELVIVCTPVGRIGELVRAITPWLAAECVVTDVGSTKASIVATGEAAWPRFVGSHPMAGSEKSGVAAARADLFDGATCVVTPTVTSEGAAVELVESFWQAMGCRVVRESPIRHDRLVALVSHLPHALAAALVLTQTPESRRLAGPGYRDTTRVAAGDPTLWREILIDNGPRVIEALGAFEAELATLRRALEARDADAVEAFLERAARAK